jgi:hypothetical protein
VAFIGVCMLLGHHLKVPKILKIIAKCSACHNLVGLQEAPLDEDLPIVGIPADFVKAYLSAERWWESPDKPDLNCRHSILEDWYEWFAASISTEFGGPPPDVEELWTVSQVSHILGFN